VVCSDVCSEWYRFQLSTEIIPTKVSQCLQAGFLDLYLVDYTECVSELLNPISTHILPTTSLQRDGYRIYINSWKSTVRDKK